ncbi:hypothetical protein [uncultured Rummeliibacillus sp.]|uniref:hypothetical protein n=1 Tax=uncultured Rummeliibacillus sp. TaxID=762292 RepID=UPI002616FD1C|nr:hypothetical protein [uncultured Rummeliibacillus sp.]
MWESPYTGIPFLLIPISLLFFGTRRKTRDLYYSHPDWEPFRRITPFSTKVNFYLWMIFIFGGSIFLLYAMVSKILYDFGWIN